LQALYFDDRYQMLSFSGTNTWHSFWAQLQNIQLNLELFYRGFDQWWRESSDFEKRCCEDSTRVTSFTEWLDSSLNDWLTTRVRFIFAKSPNILLTSTGYFAHREWSFFASVTLD